MKRSNNKNNKILRQRSQRKMLIKTQIMQMLKINKMIKIKFKIKMIGKMCKKIVILKA